MSRRRLRVLVMMHQDLVPPDSLEGLSDADVSGIKTEYDVVVGLSHLGHEVVQIGLHDEIAPLRAKLREVEPHVVFNLLEEFHGHTVYDQHVVAYLELARQAYTGCNPRGLVLGRDKALSKKILHYHRIRTPGFAVFPRERKVRRPKRLGFPLIVKSLIEEGSTGISQASVVTSDEKLEERVEFIHRNVGTDAIVEQFIEGRDIYASVLGNFQLKVFPPWELKLGDLPADSYRIATRKAKWDLEYQKKYRVEIDRVELDADVRRRYESVSRRIYRVLGLSGLARIDYRLGTDGNLYFLEANPNPDIARDEEFACAARASGLEYEPLLQRLLTLGMSHMRTMPGEG